jgi:hypothetical protein
LAAELPDALEVDLFLSLQDRHATQGLITWTRSDSDLSVRYAGTGAEPEHPSIRWERCANHTNDGLCCMGGGLLVWRQGLSSERLEAVNYDLEMQLLELDI